MNTVQCVIKESVLTFTEDVTGVKSNYLTSNNEAVSLQMIQNIYDLFIYYLLY